MGKKRRTYIPNHQLTPDKRTNELFEKYYSDLKLLDETEWKTFIDVMKSDLPSTFRVTGFGSQRKELLFMLENQYFNDILDNCDPESNEEAVNLSCLKWYPGGTAWQLSASKNNIRKNKNLKKLHQFLISETESGNTSRQEAVSMIPPLLLDIQSHHKILDLCAAPGSKSAQLVELLHENFETRQEKGEESSSEPSGVVIANDIEMDRCYMMTHQLKRLRSPCFMVTKEDAAIFPRLYISNPEIPGKNQQIQYDRILADVPCSGDGTMRKNPQIWISWRPSQGIGEHFLQIRILKRGLELLRDDGTGRLVYSTCSLNPVEDEAVIASLLNDAHGAVELVEPPQWFGPKGVLKGRPGVTSWSVMLKDGSIFRSYDDLPDKHKSSHKPSLFPPSNVQELHLEKCRRVFPHDQNTGGFFIAILKKIAPLPWMKKPKMTNSEENTNMKDDHAVENKQPETKGLVKIGKLCYKRGENPYKYINPKEDKEWISIVDYYGVSDDQKCPSQQILYRPTDIPNCKRNNFYYTNKCIKDIIEANSDKGLTVINCGVPMFTLCDDKQYSGYRLSQEGAEIFMSSFKGAMTPREIVLREKDDQRRDLAFLFKEEIPLIENFNEETKKQWAKLTNGPLIIRYEPESGTQKLPKHEVILTGWRGAKSMRHYLKVHERLHLCRMCGFELTEPVKMVSQKKLPDEANGAEPESKIPRMNDEEKAV